MVDLPRKEKRKAIQRSRHLLTRLNGQNAYDIWGRMLVGNDYLMRLPRESQDDRLFG